MEKTDAVAALAALAQDNRLDVFRLLVQAGPEGMPAGAIAEALGLAPVAFLTENCCGGVSCAPECKPARKRSKVPA
jgi:ArsR family transcriptional regulator, arsenate/arsenite/antimonite-responsive transcriptional repressor